MLPQTSYVHGEIQRATRSTMVGGLVLLIFAAICVAGSWGYWRDLVHGPVTLDDDGWTALIFLAPMALIGAAMVALGSRRLSDPQSHPIFKGLQAYGDPADLVRRIDREVAGRSDMYDTPSGSGATRIKLTRSWLLASPPMRFIALPLDDIVWAHKHVLRHHLVLKVVSLVLYSKSGKSTRFKVGVMSEKPVDQLLAQLATRRPWMLLGYDRRLAKAWRKDRAGVIATVEARRQAGLAAAAEKRA